MKKKKRKKKQYQLNKTNHQLLLHTHLYFCESIIQILLYYDGFNYLL